MILLYIFLLVGLIYFIFFIAQFHNIVFKGYAPFISTDVETLKKIIDDAHIKADSTIYELGSGRARFLRILEKARPQAKLIGIENLLTIYLIIRIKLKLQGSKIQLFKKDFFTVDLKEADIVYCYLNSITMKKLGNKFQQECKRGTQIISRSFSIPQFEPESILKVKGKKVYFYII